MRVIQQRQVQNDTWLLDNGEGELPTSGDVIVPLSRWQAERDQLLSRTGRLGIALNSDQSLSEILADLAHFDLIGLHFGSFRNGQHYSNAWLLRQRHAYRGEIRALDQVGRDQIAFLQRVGIDSFAISEEQDPAELLQGLAEISVIYQPSTDGELIFRQRGWQQATNHEVSV